MIEKGCLFGWYFTYMPIGQHARPELLVTPEQRQLMYERVHEFRATKDIFLIDFGTTGNTATAALPGPALPAYQRQR